LQRHGVYGIEATIVCRIAYSVRLDFFVSDEQDYRDGEKGGLFPVAFEAGRA
jgi:hypothetical protein